MRAGIVTAGLVLAWLVTPESLVNIGKVAGMSGSYVIVVLFVAFAMSVFSAYILFHPFLVENGYEHELSPLRQMMGRVFAHALQLSGRIPLLLFVSTAMLVTAGFAFNEIFLYWFPNFLFASLLLYLIAAVNLFNENVALKLQSMLVAVTLAALACFLLIALFTSSSGNVEVTDSIENVRQLQAAPFFLAFLSFLGFDFHRQQQQNRAVYFSLFLGFILLACWSTVAAGNAKASSLINSSISYMHIARAVAGDPGRYIVGIGVIGGIAAGVNGLFIVGKRSLSYFFAERQLQVKSNVGWISSIIFAAVIETMMLTGFAGEKIIEIQLKAVVVLWLMYLAARIFAAGHIVGITKKGFLAISILIGLSVLFIMAYLVVTEPMKLYVVTFCVVTFTATIFATAVWIRFGIKVSLKS